MNRTFSKVVIFISTIFFTAWLLSYGSSLWHGIPGYFSADNDILATITLVGPIIGGFIVGFAIQLSERYTKVIRINHNVAGAFLGYVCIFFTDILLGAGFYIVPYHIIYSTEIANVTISYLIQGIFTYSLLGALGGVLGSMLRRSSRFYLTKMQNS